ncbi:hypothetical protein Y032_0397g711 [Ancylostoma ceylanicum]|uniref:Uncharacterized protein n=1 Tax=Ancylostoma ceylanicum TaxID=53326 RepID=A0A016RS22_9BILA|nr:hypothetical protein Y032_0397g711 [Ancylostoma ceylanicum]
MTMKERYDKQNSVDMRKLRKVGDRVYVKLPREKSSQKFPKLHNEWGGPHRVIETSENSALLAHIYDDVEPIRIQHDMLIIIPKEVREAPTQTKTKQVKRRAKQNKSPRTNVVFCRATVDHDGDTSPLGMFFTCSGRTRENGISYQFTCTIKEKKSKDVANVNDDTIGNLRFHTMYGLARLISIYETEKNEKRRIFLMKDEKYKLITIDGMQKAFTLYKKYCDHVFRAIALHDGSRQNLPHDGGTGISIKQLNDLNNEGVSFVKVHTWEEITVKLMTRKALLLLPSGFRSHNAVFESNDDYDICIYKQIPDIADMVKTLVDLDPRAAVVVTPTTNTPIPKQEWMQLSTSIAKVALRGTKVVVAGPRGEKAWEQNRIEK